MARFAQYALVASQEALEDAGWMPATFEQKETTVCAAFCSCVSLSYLFRGDLSRVRDWEFRRDL